MEIPKQNLANVINRIIQHNDAFFEMSADFPSIAADLQTFKNNPNCSCKNKVTKFISAKIEAGEKDILNKYFINRENLKNAIDKMNDNYEQKILSGKIIIIDNTKEAWATLSQESNTKIYKSFSVLEKNDKLHVYFL
jgi:hypothetical protein